MNPLDQRHIPPYDIATAPPPPPMPGSEEWARWQIVNAFKDDADQRAITDIVAAGLVPRPSLWAARQHYARACTERHWMGWQARLVWAIVEALLKDPLDADIPF